MQKLCPNCHRLVNARVAACPHCRWNFARASKPAGDTSNPLKALGAALSNLIHEQPSSPASRPLSDEKKCPQCAETVKWDARVCRFCGWSFAKGSQTPRPASKNSFQSCMTAIGVIVVILVVLSVIGKGTTNNEGGSANTSDAIVSEPPVQVSATDLAGAFDENEAAAMQKYGDRWLAVTGIVTGVDLDISDSPVVKLESGKFLSVQAQFTKDDLSQTAELKRGSQATVVCRKLTEVMGSPLLDECSFPPK